MVMIDLWLESSKMNCINSVVFFMGRAIIGTNPCWKLLSLLEVLHLIYSLT